MDLPLEIKNKLLEIALRYPIKDLKEAASILSKDYIEKENKENIFIDSSIKAVAYSLMRFPATYAASFEVIKSALELLDYNYASILDVGAGLGASSLAYLSIKDNHSTFTLLEKDQEMIKLGKEILPSNLNYLEEDMITSKLIKSDLVISSYSINEISEDNLLPLIYKLWAATNKTLIFITPGTPKCYERLMKIRDYLIKNNGYIVAPCPHSNECKLNKSDWCHFVVRIERNKLHKLLKSGDAPYEDEKFSYLVINKEKIEEHNYSRILRHPIKCSNHITLSLCNKENISELDIYKKDKEQFKKAKKSKTNDLFNWFDII